MHARGGFARIQIILATTLVTRRGEYFRRVAIAQRIRVCILYFRGAINRIAVSWRNPDSTA